MKTQPHTSSSRTSTDTSGTYTRIRGVSRGYRKKFPLGNTPYQIMTRLLEECGELAQLVNYFEGSGTKRKKYGKLSGSALAAEVRDVFIAALQLVDYYNVEKQLLECIDSSFRRLCAQGFITPPMKARSTRASRRSMRSRISIRMR